MTYTAETRPDTKKISKMLEVAEMKTLRKIAEKILLDQEVQTSEEVVTQKTLHIRIHIQEKTGMEPTYKQNGKGKNCQNN